MTLIILPPAAQLKFADLGQTLTNDLVKSPDTTIIHSLPFDISMLESSLFDRQSSIAFYDR
ncbi:MAG: hypothetical protein KAG66_22535, partial [Methylococcales bacterium]|nr:hypothetical protein [Methylococcales bacterium]